MDNHDFIVAITLTMLIGAMVTFLLGIMAAMFYCVDGKNQQGYTSIGFGIATAILLIASYQTYVNYPL